MTFETVARTDTGRQRDRNEDAVLRTEIGSAQVIAVADGMGGHADGELASVAAVERFDAKLVQLVDEQPIEDAMCAAVDAANEGVLDDTDPHRRSGTTLVAAYVDGETATIVNVGDSRAYHVTDEAIERITVDQSHVQQLLEDGEITEEEAHDHPHRNVVSQALGTSLDVDPDLYECTVTGTLLLCSDGLTEEVSEPVIQDLVTSGGTLEIAADRLIERANENGGSDNISVVLGRQI